MLAEIGRHLFMISRKKNATEKMKYPPEGVSDMPADRIPSGLDITKRKMPEMTDDGFVQILFRHRRSFVWLYAYLRRFEHAVPKS
jgi:hypothetical protein